MKKMKRFIAILLTLVLAIGILPAAASAASVDPQGAAQWDPLTPPSQVYGTLVGTNTFQASTTLNAGKNGYLRAVPTLDVPSGYYIYTYNASAYCGAKAVSSNPNVVDVKSIEIGKWQGGAWDGADCMQVTVDPKQAGTATVTINFYYTFSQSANPFTNRNAQWFYGTMYYTVKVTGSTQYTITYTDGVDDAEIFPNQVSKAVKGSATPAFNGVPERSGYLLTGWSPEVAPTVTADQTYTATWVKLETVVIYGVTGQDKATKEKLFTVKAPHGANLVDFLNSLDIDLSRDNNDCEGWYNFDWFGHKFNAAVTVNGWMNVYVNYTPKEPVNAPVPFAE